LQAVRWSVTTSRGRRRERLPHRFLEERILRRGVGLEFPIYTVGTAPGSVIVVNPRSPIGRQPAGELTFEPLELPDEVLALAALGNVQSGQPDPDAAQQALHHHRPRHVLNLLGRGGAIVGALV
jgi:hypothetical protein